MKRSNFSVADSLKDADFAAPYVERDRELKLVPFRPLDNIGPAGSINSSVNEMLEWIKVNLEQHDQELIKQSTLREMHTPQTIVGGYPVEPEAFLSTYGLGWMIQSYRGRYNVLHGGAIDGFSALVSLFPMDGLGIVVLANKSGAGINGLLVNHVVDHILGLETKPWLAEALVKRNKGLEAVEQAEKKREMTRVKGTSTSHPLSDYAGQYEHPGYGVAAVELLNGELIATYNQIVTALEHWHYDVFNGLESEDPVLENFKFEFRLNTRGEVDALVVALDPEVESIVFQRKPDARLFEPDFLSKLTGKFTLATGVITVELKGSTLFASVSGQPVFELVPRRGVEFDLKGVSGFSVRFVLDESERVTEIQLIQPNGVFVATPAEGPQ
ncbi:MAG: DUF3471 domain-containing protein, partial [Acidobacteriota bacterium]